MLTKRRRVESSDVPGDFQLPLKGLELVLSRRQPQILALDHVEKTLADMLIEYPRRGMESATQAKLPNMVR